MLSVTEILSASTIKRSVVEQGIFLKKKRVMRQELQVSTNCKLQVFILKLRVVNYELNLKLQFSKTFAVSNFEIPSC